MAAMSDYLENKLIDQIFRAQAFAFPATLYVALYTAAPSDAGGGTEVAGGSYARVAIGASLLNFAGTQAAASTTASTGTNGTTSNNAAITFPAPTANWGVVTHFAMYDAPAPLAAPVQSAPSTVTTGGSLAAATYYYVVTATNAAGETLKSNELSITTTGTTSTNTVNWAAVSGATGYRIYRGTAAGTEGVYYSVGAVTTFSDTGAANTAGTPPAGNTTGGNELFWGALTTAKTVNNADAAPSFAAAALSIQIDN